MSCTRRHFLHTAGAAAGAVAWPASPLQAAAARIDLTAGVFKQAVRARGPQTEVWGFNGSVPGPLLRFAQGDRVDVHLVNRLAQATTVHWHGVRVPNEMDGVPQVTQKPVEPGASFDYGFTVPDAGTYWYHPHQSSFEQVPRGLYGAIIVDEPKPVQVDREVLWLLSDFKLDADNGQVEDFGKILDFGATGRHGNVITINGKAIGPRNTLEMRPGERIRLRLVNAASARIFRLQFNGHSPWVVAYDGQPVAPHPIPNGFLFLAPGQRTDLVIDGHNSLSTAAFSIMDRRMQATEIARIVYHGKPIRTSSLPRPAPMAPNRLTEPKLASATKHFLVFEGGVKGRPAIGQIDGKAVNVEEIMSRHGLTWTMNYTAQHEHAMMHEPMFTMKKGEHVQLRMINNTIFEHPMHLHGHFFRVLAFNGKPTRLREWRDTVMLGPNGTCDIAFVADNVGEWMFHCHVLDHAAGGMMGTVVVED
jgi:FtsP/CotA-like multicopper oxidase with cupredoxin domain